MARRTRLEFYGSRRFARLLKKIERRIDKRALGGHTQLACKVHSLVSPMTGWQLRLLAGELRRRGFEVSVFPFPGILRDKEWLAIDWADRRNARGKRAPKKEKK